MDSVPDHETVMKNMAELLGQVERKDEGDVPGRADSGQEGGGGTGRIEYKTRTWTSVVTLEEASLGLSPLKSRPGNTLPLL